MSMAFEELEKLARALKPEKKAALARILIEELDLQNELFNHGYERAVTSGELAPRSGDLQALEEHAKSMVRAAHSDAFDPTTNVHDKVLDAKYRKNLTDRGDVEQAAKFAEADVAQHEEAAGRVHAGSLPPKPANTLVVWLVVATMITVALTLHDTTFLMDDHFISWALSLGCGLFLGVLIALMILGDTDAAGHRTIANWMGLSAGIFVSVALGALRIGVAKTVGDIVFAVGTTVLELCIVLMLENVATRRRAAMSEWSVYNNAAEMATAALDAAKTNLERWEEQLKYLNESISKHIYYVEERNIRTMHIDELEAAALEAAKNGYLAGINSNRGRMIGVHSECIPLPSQVRTQQLREEPFKTDTDHRLDVVRQIDHLREQLLAQYGEMPDSVELLREDRTR